MARVKAVSAYKMAKRIYNREDNVYDKKVITKQLITNILLMYMDECRKALAEGERIEISKVGSIIPEVKVHEGNFNLPMCNFLKNRNIWMIICHGTPWYRNAVDSHCPFSIEGWWLFFYPLSYLTLTVGR